MNYEDAQAAIQTLREHTAGGVVELYGIKILDVFEALQERVDALEKV